jgi:hypothetical protein
MKKGFFTYIFAVLLLLNFCVYANELDDDILDEPKELTAQDLANQEIAQRQAALKERSMQDLAQIGVLQKRIEELNEKLKDNILLKRYSNYLAYRKISKELELLKQSAKGKGKTDEHYSQLNNKIRIKQNELELISEYKGSPIGSLLSPPEVEKYEDITNPFGIINALSYIKKLENNKKEFITIEKDIANLISLLGKKVFLYLELYNLDQKTQYKEILTFLDKQKKDFNMVLEIVSTTEEVYTRKVEQVTLEIKSQISTIFYIIFNKTRFKKILFTK